MKQTFTVLRAFRIGAAQRWLKPGDRVALLPCESQYPLLRGWLNQAADAAPESDNSKAAKTKKGK